VPSFAGNDQQVRPALIALPTSGVIRRPAMRQAGLGKARVLKGKLVRRLGHDGSSSIEEPLLHLRDPHALAFPGQSTRPDAIVARQAVMRHRHSTLPDRFSAACGRHGEPSVH
jgi:hypothetical protein